MRPLALVLVVFAVSCATVTAPLASPIGESTASPRALATNVKATDVAATPPATVTTPDAGGGAIPSTAATSPAVAPGVAPTGAAPAISSPPATARTTTPTPTPTPPPPTLAPTAPPTPAPPSTGIFGKIADQGGSPIAGVAVNAVIASPCCTTVGVARTGSDGTYALALAAGTYKVTFLGVNADEPWVQQWWRGRATLDQADPVTVTGPVRLDAIMILGGALQGHVSDAVTGAPLPAAIEIYDAASPCCISRIAGTGTRSDGSYAVILPRRPVWVLFIATGYKTAYGASVTDPAQAKPVTITTLTQLDAQLVRK